MCLFHAWEIIKEEEVPDWDHAGCTLILLKRKVCLKCGKIIDEISNYHNGRKMEKISREQRQQKAIEIYESKTRQEEMEDSNSNR